MHNSYYVYTPTGAHVVEGGEDRNAAAAATAAAVATAAAPICYHRNETSLSDVR